MELTRTPRLLLRHWEQPDLQAFFDLYSRDDVMRWLGPHPRRAPATMDEARERLARWGGTRLLDPPLGMWAMVPLSPEGQAVAARLGMSDEGTTGRWFGLTARQYRKVIAVRDR
jgi:RimJ/RimL family protein N-acetyltransferase